MSKPTLDEILETTLKANNLHILPCEKNIVRTKQQITQLIADIIGEDDKHPAWCSDSCDSESHVTNTVRHYQRKRAKERGIDL